MRVISRHDILALCYSRLYQMFLGGKGDRYGSKIGERLVDEDTIALFPSAARLRRAQIVGRVAEFLMIFVPPKSPVVGLPVCAAPTCHGFHSDASARMTPAVGLKHSVGSPAW